MNTYCSKFVWHMVNVCLMKTSTSVQCDSRNRDDDDYDDYDDDNDEEDVYNKIWNQVTKYPHSRTTNISF